jgi:hypothetical protein
VGTNYKSTLLIIPEEKRFHLHHGGSLISLYLLVICLYEIYKRRKAVVFG